MSDYPPPPPPPGQTLSYYTPNFPQGPRRPLSVSIIAWVAIVFGGLGALSPLCLLPKYLMSGLPKAPNPFQDFMDTSPGLHEYQIVIQIIGWLVSVLMLAGGIGCLKLKPWARQIMVGLGVYQLISVVVGVAVNFGWILPAFNRFAAGQGKVPGVMLPLKIFMISSIVGTVIGFAIAVILLYYMTRPQVIEAFEPPAAMPLPPAI